MIDKLILLLIILLTRGGSQGPSLPIRDVRRVINRDEMTRTDFIADFLELSVQSVSPRERCFRLRV